MDEVTRVHQQGISRHGISLRQLLFERPSIGEVQFTNRWPNELKLAQTVGRTSA